MSTNPTDCQDLIAETPAAFGYERPHDFADSAKVCDRGPADLPRPDIEEGHAYRLRKLASLLIDQRTYWQARAGGESGWREQINDTPEVRGFCRQLSEFLAPLIGSVLEAAARHDAEALKMRS